WKRLVDLLDLSEFAGPEFATYRQRQAQYDAIKTRLDQVFLMLPLAAWLTQLQAHDIPANGLATPEEALDDPAGRVVGR
ncbi:CoA transferase, partial [Acinetobacter baumannii]